MRISEQERVKFLEDMEKHLLHIFRKKDVDPNEYCFLKEILVSIDMQILRPLLDE